jgi:small ligand-binding sensory domain FIST
MVTRLGDTAALTVLGTCAKQLEGHPTILCALSLPTPPGSESIVVVRPVRGIDPGRGGVLVSKEATVGASMTFCICDPDVARSELDRTSRELARGLSGAAPEFGLLLRSESRGSAMYRGREVEEKIAVGRFPGVPFSGMLSTFEIGPAAGQPTVHTHSGVVAVFGAPS